MWTVVIGGIILTTLIICVVVMVSKLTSGRTSRANTLKTLDRPSSCEDAFDLSYRSKDYDNNQPEVKFLIQPLSDEEWTDSFCRAEYAPVMYEPKKKRQFGYNTFT